MSYYIDIGREVEELRGVFPEVSKSDFYELDNGNVGAVVYYTPNDPACPEFEVLIEYPRGYPNDAPKAWALSPELPRSVPHVLGRDDSGNVQICYQRSSNWNSNYTGYDAAVMVKTWVYAYCNWKNNDEWDWNEGY